MTRPEQKPIAELWREIDAFNARHAVGDTIHVWRGGINKTPAEPALIVEPGAWLMGGHSAVVQVADMGCIALSHVRLDPPQPKPIDPELRAMEAAYLVLKGMPREQWGRALTYLARRLSSDDRGVHLNMNIDDFPEPTAWAFEGDFYTTATSDDEVLMNHGEGLLTVVEVTGIAVVSRKFGVAVAICDDDGGVEGHEPVWFATRETAEAFVAELKAGPDALGEDAT